MKVSRRAFLVLCALLGGASRVDAQPRTLPRVGILGLTSGGRDVEQGLRALGWIDGRTVTIERRFVSTYEQLAKSARELVQLGVAVIVCTNAPATQAAKDATQSIPIVMAPAGDPVAAGFVPSLAAPAGNVTGLAIMHTELTGKRLELLTEAVPGSRRLATLSNPTNPSTPAMLREIDARAPLLGVEVVRFEADTVAQLPPAFTAMVERKVRGVVVLGDPFFFAEAPRIIGLALQHRLPAVYEWRRMAEQGGLLAYGPRLDELRRRAAGYVDKILKGAKPGELAVEQPTTFELAVNLRTAKALGITLPRALVLRADVVIE